LHTVNRRTSEMNMQKENVNFSTISFDEIAGNGASKVTNKFIVSDKNMHLPEIFPFHPYIMDGIVFVMCVEGKGKIKINLKEYDFQKNSIACILPGFIIEVQDCVENFCIEYLFFSYNFFSDMRIFLNADIPFKIVQQPCLRLDQDEVNILLEYHSLIVKRYTNEHLPFYNKIIRNLLRALLYEIMCIYEKSSTGAKLFTNRNEEIFYQFSELLVQNYQKERSVAFYADRISITAKYLTKVIKTVTGRKALELINEMTILHIKALLKSSNLTVLQVSEELNFSSPSFFGRFFKKYTGMTPIAYRDSI
jgi:AraC family transcriptional regulator, transcriptional activator of pobA